MTHDKKNKGRSFVGTLFLLACGFAGGFFHTEILAFGKHSIASIRSR